jgi:LPS sulfotransferase NodH
VNAPSTDTVAVRFIVLGEGRTGSNLLVQALNGHPAVRCFGEVFNWTHARIDYGVEGYELRSLDDLGRRAKDPVGLLRERVWGEAPPGARALGFKLHYGHAYAYPGLEEALTSDTALRVVHLRRENLLRLLISMKRAEATGVWKEDAGAPQRQRRDPRALFALVRHPASTLARLRNARRRKEAEAAGPPPLLRLTRDECSDFFIRHELQAQRYDEMFAAHPVLHLTYEQMLADRAAAFAEAERFLGVEVTPLKVSLRRQNAQPLRESLADYDELRRAFAGTPHEAHFDDGGADVTAH